MSNLLRELLRRHGLFVAVCGVLLGGFEWLICAVVASVDVTGALGTLVQSMPPLLQSLVAERFLGDLSKSSLLAFGWAHPIAQAAGAAVAIVLAAQAVAGRAEDGTIELTLAQPLARRSYLAAHVLFALAAMLAVTLLGLAGMLAGGHACGLEPFAPRDVARLGLDYFALLVALYGLTLAFSAFGREGGRVATAGFLVALVSYLVHVIGSMWGPWEKLVPWTLHAWYVPQDILVRGESVARPLATLLGVGLAGIAVAWARFARRDLP